MFSLNIGFSKTMAPNQEEINSAILSILENANVNEFIEENIISGHRETINITDLQELGITNEYINVLHENNIDFLYFPFVELNTSNRDSVIIINLDDITSEEQLVDKVLNTSVGLADIMGRFTVMYKTEEHENDPASLVTIQVWNDETRRYENAELQLEGKWLPWRRCYCSRGTNGVDEQAEMFTTSTGSCNQYHQSEDRCSQVCDRTGFFDQTCDGDSCPGC